MATSSVELSKTELVVITGFEGEDLDVTIEQLEVRNMPESLAGFLPIGFAASPNRAWRHAASRHVQPF